jgi:3,4-dihydroxy 2-butanone 4-phosphate synthase / GTP cyclohydrolase II
VSALSIGHPAAQEPVTLDRVEDAIEAIRRGLPVLVVDDADRENEGDVIMAACQADARWLGWTVRHTSGVICAPMPDELADRLGLPPMVATNEDPRSTAFTVTVDARHGVGTGISAADRATTLRLLADPATVATDLVRPGHIFPLRARPDGVLERGGHTEAAVDLCRLAGLPPVGLLAEVVEDEGQLMLLPGLRHLADAHGLVLVSIADLARYRRRLGDARVEALPVRGAAAPAKEPSSVARVATTHLPTRFGGFTVHGYRDLSSGTEHVALVAGNPGDGCLVRVHSECLTGDALGSLRCDCGPQLAAALEVVGLEGGVVVYVGGHEGRGIGLLAKLTAYALQDNGLDTVAANTEQGLPADARDYGAAAAILADLGLASVRLLTNNPAKIDGLAAHGVQVSGRVPLVAGVSTRNGSYLRAKRDLMGHLLVLDDPADDEEATR